MSELSKDQINVDLFDEVVRLKSELKETEERIKKLERLLIKSERRNEKYNQLIDILKDLLDKEG